MMASKNGFKLQRSYETEVYFPSQSRTEGYIKLEKEIPEELKKCYDFEIIDGEVWAREKVLNLLYVKG